MTAANYVCIKEDKIAELEAKAEYKEKRIDELDRKMDKIDGKLDKLTENINNIMLHSIQDDNNLNQRVTTLETIINTQNKVLQQYKEDAKRHRDEERAKTNQRLTAITVGITVLTFILTHFWK